MWWSGKSWMGWHTACETVNNNKNNHLLLFFSMFLFRSFWLWLLLLLLFDSIILHLLKEPHRIGTVSELKSHACFGLHCTFCIAFYKFIHFNSMHALWPCVRVYIYIYVNNSIWRTVYERVLIQELDGHSVIFIYFFLKQNLLLLFFTYFLNK